MITVAVAVALGGCRPGAERATLPAGERPVAAAPRHAASPDNPDAAARRLVRAALQPTLDTFLSKPGVDVTFQEPAMHIATPESSVLGATLYFNDYAIDLPRELVKSVNNPWLFRAGGGWVLDGNCRLTIFIDSELGLAATVGEIGACLDLEAEGLGVLLREYPAQAERFQADVRRQLTFASDYAVLKAIYATDFRTLDYDRLSAAETFTAAALAGVKSVLPPSAAGSHVSRVETPHFQGIAYGDLDKGEMAWIDLHDAGRHIIRFTCGCSARHHARKEPLVKHLRRMVGSVRHHGSSTPGRDLLAAARVELQRPESERSLAIARSLVLCASRYDDAYDEAVQLGKTLVDPEADNGFAYLAVLSRACESGPSAELPASQPAESPASQN